MKLLVALLSFTFVFTWWPGKEAAPPSSKDALEARAVLDEVNALRASGCKCPDGKRFRPAPALIWDTRLEKAAQEHAADMSRERYFSHTSLDGSSFSERISRTGYPWQFVGENIAKGYPSAKAVVDAWRTSKDHCPNLMNPYFRDMGIGKAGAYWVQDLGTQPE
ncbi:MAG: CAP domain-containing protein [Saprospirales bacterium]|jgi:uncharacterized protein YkwD|nr:CAP domain-containing protein [Saprospirales bacterium]MBK8920685.1 CAP domain-containing protein [Saprospirales bacterium]